MKISSILFFVIVVAAILITSVSVDNREEKKIKFIQIDGNIHLPSDEYFRFANIENELLFENLTPSIVKDRLEKHPYIQRVDVILNENSLSVTIFEKKFESMLMYNDTECLITENNIKIPKLPASEKIDYPIISNPLDADKLGVFENVLSNSDVTIGLKIISTLKLINPDLFESLSEIDMRNGKDIVILFSDFSFPIVIGRNNEIDKIMYLEQLVQSLDNNFLQDKVEYIDLRYSDYIYLGRSVDKNGDAKGSNS